MKKLGIIVVFTIIVLGAIYLGINVFATKKVATKIDHTIQKTAVFANVTYKSVKVNAIRKNVNIDQIVIIPKEGMSRIEIENISINNIDTKNPFPLKMKLSINGIKLITSSANNLMTFLTEIGYTGNHKGNILIDYKYNSAQKELLINNIEAGVDDMANLSLKAVFSNIEISPDSLNGFFTNYQGIKLNKIQITYIDHSLFNKLLQIFSDYSETDLNSAKISIKNYIDAFINLFGLDSLEGIKTDAVNLKRFIDDPGKISINVNLSKPLSLSNIELMENPVDILNMLTIKVDFVQ